MTPVANCVQEGAAFLDQKVPDWWRENHEPPINLHILSMKSTRFCVLGQLAARALPINREFEQVTSYFGMDDGSAVSLGFDRFEDSAVTFQQLHSAWAELIEGRRAAVPS